MQHENVMLFQSFWFANLSYYFFDIPLTVVINSLLNKLITSNWLSYYYFLNLHVTFVILLTCKSDDSKRLWLSHIPRTFVVFCKFSAVSPSCVEKNTGTTTSSSALRSSWAPFLWQWWRISLIKYTMWSLCWNCIPGPRALKEINSEKVCFCCR